ncbi:hypothetical protein Ancab_000530 [Ancistrocladus abbreviatus]
MVTLSNAHSIGVSHFSSFSNRLYSFNATSPQDPSMDPKFASDLKTKCPSPTNDPNSTVALDVLTPNRLDNKYYKNLQNSRGLLTSDQTLMTSSSTASMVQNFTRQGGVWANRFSTAMVRMGSIEVLSEGSTDAVSSDSPHAFPRSSRVTRPNLPPDPSVLVKSPEGCRNCSSDAPSVLPLRSGRTALDGSSLVLVGDAGRSRGSGGHLGHAPASCLRGAEAVDLTGNGAGRSRSSGGHLASAPASCLRGADAVDLNGNAARSWGSGGQHALHSHEMVHCSSCLRGSPVDDVEEHNGNAAKNTDGGEQHAQNNHVHAHCSSCLRGAPVTEAVVLNGNAATNLGSGGQFSGKSLDLCRLANPPDSDPRTAEVHAARGSSPSDNVCASSKGYARQQGHEGTFGASQQRHLSGVGSSVFDEGHWDFLVGPHVTRTRLARDDVCNSKVSD